MQLQERNLQQVHSEVDWSFRIRKTLLQRGSGALSRARQVNYHYHKFLKKYYFTKKYFFRNEDDIMVNIKTTKTKEVAPRETKRDSNQTKLGQAMDKEFRLITLSTNYGSQSGDFQNHLGIFIARKSQNDIGCHGYFIAHVMPDGLVKR